MAPHSFIVGESPSCRHPADQSRLARLQKKRYFAELFYLASITYRDCSKGESGRIQLPRRKKDLEIREVPETGNGRKATIAVVGGGMSGLTAALRLARSGRFRVTLLEKAPDLGGLCAPASIDGLTVDGLPRHPAEDRATRRFYRRARNERSDRLRISKAGFFGRDASSPSPRDSIFSAFPSYPPWSKVRLGWGILRTAHAAPPGGPEEPAPGNGSPGATGGG
jgi:hypothetical protein